MFLSAALNEAIYSSAFHHPLELPCLQSSPFPVALLNPRCCFTQTRRQGPRSGPQDRTAPCAGRSVHPERPSTCSGLVWCAAPLCLALLSPCSCCLPGQEAGTRPPVPAHEEKREPPRLVPNCSIVLHFPSPVKRPPTKPFPHVSTNSSTKRLLSARCRRVH